SRKKHVKDLRKEYETRLKYDFPVTWLESNQIKEVYGLNNNYGGILSKKGGSMDAFRMTHDLLRYNAKRGLKIYDKTELKNILYKKVGVESKTHNGNTIKASKVIFCTGYEITEVIKEKIVDLLSTYVIIGERQDIFPSSIKDTLFWNTEDPYLYV